MMQHEQKSKEARNVIVRLESEAGQAIVLIALFMIVLLAMVGVAIDGGGLFLLWRDAQNAADTAAIQAAFHRCTGGGDWVIIGEDAAEDNGFNSNGSSNIVTVGNETIDGVDFVKVTIDAEKPAYFIQLVYPWPLEIQATALVFCSAAVDFADFPGAMAFGDCNCPANQTNPRNYSGGVDGVEFMGSDITITGGIHSNCDMDVNGNASSQSVTFTDVGPTAANDVDPGSSTVSMPSGQDIDDGDGADPVPDENPLQLDLDMYMIGGDIYNAVLLNSGKAYTANGDWKPGSNDSTCRSTDYCSDSPNPGVQARPDPLEGLFFVDGDVDLTSIDLNMIDKPGVPLQSEWNGLTIVSTGQIKSHDPNDFTWAYYGHNGPITGDFGVAIEIDKRSYPWILAYSNQNDNFSPCNVGGDAAISIGGPDNDTDDDIIGVLYAPTGYVSYSGNSVDGRGAILALKIDWSGSNVDWIYEPHSLPPIPPSLSNVK